MGKNEHLFPYRWKLSDGYPAKGIEYHGKTVFGTFVCGGGSTMGYKLAGFHHLGGVEIDPVVADIYRRNNHPERLYSMDIRDFNRLEDLPAELYQLDLLDGSPPCSTFSTAGIRDKAWGKQKKFAEGQKLQTLDDLVFVYCDTIIKLQPKCFLLENVSGIIKGNAKAYTKRICQYLNQNGYTVQVFCLNAATMGVPQRRERVFFIGHKAEYDLPRLVLDFDESPILFSQIMDYEDKTNDLTDFELKFWNKRRKSDMNLGGVIFREERRCSQFSANLFHSDKIAPTVTANCKDYCYDLPRRVNDAEYALVSSFPHDCDFNGKGVQWLVGMSVPPVMTAQVAYQIYLQWLSKL